MLLARGTYWAAGQFPAGDDLVNAAMREKYGRGVLLRFSGSWAMRDGRWQSLHLQTTEIPD